MKVSSLAAVEVVLAQNELNFNMTQLESNLTSMYGTKIMKMRENQSRDMGYGETGSLKQVRKGNSLCSLRSDYSTLQCCDGVDPECYGCNLDLLIEGQACDDQPTSAEITSAGDHFRDCFCDESCLLFGDCCDDHFITCQSFVVCGCLNTAFSTSTTAKPSTITSTKTSTTATHTDKALFTLLDNLKIIFKQNKVKKRPNLEKKWKRITQKWYNRHAELTKAGDGYSTPCVFDGKSFDMTISDPTDSCRVSSNKLYYTGSPVPIY